jgi:hypothetical protein
VAVLGRPGGMGRKCDLAHPQAVVGRAAVLQDPHPDRTQLNGIPIVGTGDRYLHGRTSSS